eukprot:gene5246-393_t
MYWQFNDNRQRFSPGILPQQQAYYDMPMVHGRQEMTNFALTDEDTGEVKRPMNSFLLWAKVMRKKYAKENPTMHNAEISKLLGKVWNGMTTNEKRPYVERAEKLRVIHMRDHPNYRYAPRKKKDRKQAQRMISPEIAAAFHNAIFDLKNVAAPDRHEKDEGANNQSCDYIMLTGRRDELQNALYENSKGRTHYGNMDKFMMNSSPNSGSTFHYYAPEDKLGFKVEPVAEIGDERLRQQELERKTRRDSQITAMSYDRQMSACSGQSLPSSDTPRSWCDASSIADSDGSTILPSSPESVSESLDQEVPPFLRALLDFPLHVDSRRITSMDQGVPDDRSYILNDFGDIVGKEGDGTNHRKPCMFL